MSEFITHSREETVALGERLAQHLAPGALIAFTGEGPRLYRPGQQPHLRHRELLPWAAALRAL